MNTNNRDKTTTFGTDFELEIKEKGAFWKNVAAGVIAAIIFAFLTWAFSGFPWPEACFQAPAVLAIPA